jgi:hypothetical protein
MKNDSNYQIYATDIVRNVPSENLKYLIKLFMDKASINMGSDYNEKSLSGSIEIITQYFSYIPICYVASGFIRGSLGDYGPGRLVPRTIKGWMVETSTEYNRDQAKKLQQDKLNDVSIAMDLHNWPVGSAIQKKIDWYRKGLLKIEDWDKVPLKELAERIKNKLESYPEVFGIKSSKT